MFESLVVFEVAEQCLDVLDGVAVGVLLPCVECQQEQASDEESESPVMLASWRWILGFLFLGSPKIHVSGVRGVSGRLIRWLFFIECRRIEFSGVME